MVGKEEKKIDTFLEVSETKMANLVDMGVYRIERFSDTKNAWIFVKRKTPVEPPNDTRDNFIEAGTIERANEVDMSVYRFEIFSETRGTWMFVKRRVV